MNASTQGVEFPSAAAWVLVLTFFGDECCVDSHGSTFCEGRLEWLVSPEEVRRYIGTPNWLLTAPLSIEIKLTRVDGLSFIIYKSDHYDGYGRRMGMASTSIDDIYKTDDDFENGCSIHYGERFVNYTRRDVRVEAYVALGFADNGKNEEIVFPDGEWEPFAERVEQPESFVGFTLDFNCKRYDTPSYKQVQQLFHDLAINAAQDAQ